MQYMLIITILQTFNLFYFENYILRQGLLRLVSKCCIYSNILNNKQCVYKTLWDYSFLCIYFETWKVLIFLRTVLYYN